MQTATWNDPTLLAAIDKMHLFDTVYLTYFHPPAWFSDDQLIRLETLGAVKDEIDRLRADKEAKLTATKDREKMSNLEDDLNELYCELQSVIAALKDYSPRKRLDSLVDPNKTPSERWD
jgi:hypothetical protein